MSTSGCKLMWLYAVCTSTGGSMWPSHHVLHRNMSTPMPSCRQQTRPARTCLCSLALRSVQCLESCFLKIAVSCLFPNCQRKDSHLGIVGSGVSTYHLTHATWRGSSVSGRQLCPLYYLAIPMNILSYSLDSGLAPSAGYVGDGSHVPRMPQELVFS